MVGKIISTDDELSPWIKGYVGLLVLVIAALLFVHVSQMARFRVDTTTVLLLVLLVLAPSAPRITSLEYGGLKATFAQKVQAAKADFDATIGTANPQQVMGMTEAAETAVERSVNEAVSDVRSNAYRRYRLLPGAGLVEVLDVLRDSLQALLGSDTTDLGGLASELRRRVRNDNFHEVDAVLDAESVDAFAEFVALSETALDEYCTARVGNTAIRELVELGLSYVAVLGMLYAAEYNAQPVQRREYEPDVSDDWRYGHEYARSIRDEVERITAEDSAAADDEEGIGYGS